MSLRTMADAWAKEFGLYPKDKREPSKVALGIEVKWHVK